MGSSFRVHRLRRVREIWCEKIIARIVVYEHRFVQVDACRIFVRPFWWNRRVVLAQIPVNVEDFREIFRETRAVLHEYAELLYLRQRSPVHIGTTSEWICMRIVRIVWEQSKARARSLNYSLICSPSNIKVFRVDNPHFRMQYATTK